MRRFLLSALIITGMLGCMHVVKAIAIENSGPLPTNMIAIKLIDSYNDMEMKKLEYQLSRLSGIKQVQITLNKHLTFVTYYPDTIKSNGIEQVIGFLGYSIQTGSDIDESNIDQNRTRFYTVGLQCMAVPGIGCGNSAYNILSKLEASEDVEGVWMNHAGSQLSIIWVKDAKRKIPVEIFENSCTGLTMQMVELNEPEQEKAFKSFNNEHRWYRLWDLHILSKIESQTVADRTMKTIRKKTSMSKKQANQIYKELEPVLFNYLICDISRDEIKDLCRMLTNEHLSALRNPDFLYDAVMEAFGIPVQARN